MTALPKPNALLIQAINDADKATLQKVLRSMCEASEVCCQEASERLLVQHVRRLVDLEDDDQEEESGPVRKKQKRDTFITDKPASRYETCSMCHNRFDTTDNREDSCRLHDGDLEVDKNYFPDDDDIQDGVEIDVNSDWRVKEFPEGFIWSCCEEDANGPECVLGRHITIKRS